MTLKYTYKELERAIESLTRSIKYDRKSYLETGNTYTYKRIKEETIRKEFLLEELKKGQSTYDI